MLDLVGNPEECFSRVTAHLVSDAIVVIVLSQIFKSNVVELLLQGH